MDQGLVTGELYEGLWIDVGTVDRLQQAGAFMTGIEPRNPLK